MNKFILFILTGIITLNSKAYTQTPTWVNYNINDSVFDMVDDGHILWIGTGGSGLIKLNKITEELTTYNKANAGLPGNHISALATDSSGNVWIGTRKDGIGKFDGKNCVVYNTNNSELAHNQWNNAIEVDPEGNIWIGSLAWLTIFDGKTWKSYKTGNPASSYIALYDIEFDSQGIAWIGASWGLGKVEGDSVIEAYGGIDYCIYSLAVDANDTLWIGTNHSGLIKYDGENSTRFDTTNSEIPGNIIYCMKFDSKGNLWMGTNEGLARFDGEYWTIYNTENSDLPENVIFSLEIDQEDVLWLGFWHMGLVRFDGSNWKKYQLSSAALPSNNVYAIEIDKWHNIWFGTYKGLAKFDGTNWEMYDEYTGLPNPFIYSLESDRYGNLWIGARRDLCLTKFDGHNWTVYDTVNTLSRIPAQTQVNVLKLDSQENLWIGTEYSGLMKFDGFNWTVYNMDNSPLPSNIVSEITEDTEGNLWIGTRHVGFLTNEGEPVIWEGGLVKKTGDGWTVYDKNNSDLPCSSICSLVFDSEGVLWISTRDDLDVVGEIYGGGLTKFDGNGWHSYTIWNSPLTSNTIFDICIDEDENLWLGTCSGGLVKFNRRDEWAAYNKTNSGIASNTVSVIAVDSLGHKWIGHLFEGLSIFREEGVMLPGISSENNPYKKKCHLAQNYPNPFNLRTTISFTIDGTSKVKITIFDILGRVVKTLADQKYGQGTYFLEWDGTDNTNSFVSTGVYICLVKTDEEKITKKMVLLR